MKQGRKITERSLSHLYLPPRFPFDPTPRPNTPQIEQGPPKATVPKCHIRNWWEPTDSSRLNCLIQKSSLAAVEELQTHAGLNEAPGVQFRKTSSWLSLHAAPRATAPKHSNPRAEKQGNSLSTSTHTHQKGKSFVSSCSEAHTSHPETTRTTMRLEIPPECQQAFQDVSQTQLPALTPHM